jgi:hypothetical protein
MAHLIGVNLLSLEIQDLLNVGNLWMILFGGGWRCWMGA